VLLDAGAWNGTAPTRALTAALQMFGDKRAKVRRAAQAAVVEVRQDMYSWTCTVCSH
jgi:cytochrome c5